MHVRVPFEQRASGRERAMCARIGSSSTRNSPCPSILSKIVNLVTEGRTAEGRTVLNLGFEEIYACARIPFGIKPYQARDNVSCS